MSAIAIVGMSCRFADAPDLAAFWELTRDGRQCFRPVPPDRWSQSAFFSTNRRSHDLSYAPTGAWVDGVRTFPALFFGIPPRRVEVMDPQQRFSLEVAYEALLDAGLRPEHAPRRTGVFMGVTASEYRQLSSARITAQLMADGYFGTAPLDPEVLARAVDRVAPTRPFSAPGSLANMIAAAVAQELDLHGPAYTVDAACASALVALADAVAQLRTGSIDMALAGGAYLCLTPDHHIAFSRIGAISASGVCRPFDARADGFVQGDGVAIAVLKRLEDAQRDGDRIYAVIEGIATNNDGRGDGPMAPVLSGQVDAIRQAWTQVRRPAEGLGYVEAHGTGTDVGDETEVEGLRQALGGAVRSVALGSSKANIGHTMSAAGAAGLFRAALALHEQTVPPLAGFEEPKSAISWQESPFYLPKAAEPWQGEGRLAAVSSFGFGGTNGHVVLSAAERAPEADSETWELLVLSAASEQALRHYATRLADAVQGKSLGRIAYTLAVRPALAYRAAFVAKTTAGFAQQLRAFAEMSLPDGAAVGQATGVPKVALLFPGQGAQRVGMLSDARLRFPIIAETLAELESAAEGLSRPLRALLYPSESGFQLDEATASAELTRTENCQPALFACGEALRRLLDQVGLRPVAAAGHSLGEFNAAVAGGVLEASAAQRFVTARGRAMADLPGDRGSMAAIMADAATVRDLLVEGAVLANFNHPRQQVISGTTAAVDQVVARAQAAGLATSALEVSHAFHSPLMASVDVDAWVGALDLQPPRLVVASGIQPGPYASAEEAREVFRRHATSPVDFQQAVEQCLAAGADVFLQVGAGGPLASFAKKIAGSRASRVLTLGGRDDLDGGRALLSTLGWLFTLGAELDLRPLCGERGATTLPFTPLPRETYWAIGQDTQRPLELPGKATSPAPRRNEAVEVRSAAAPPAPAPTPPAEAAPPGAWTQVAAVVSKVSSYPLAAIKPTSALTEDLGFDSIMVNDLSTGLSEAFPGLGGIPRELLMNRLTVGDLVRWVEGAGSSSTSEDDDRPLTLYRPTRYPAPLPELRPRGFGEPVRWMGPGAAWAARAAGKPQDDSARTWLWVGSPQGEAGEDPARALMQALRQQTANLTLVLHEQDRSAEGAAALVRALAKERPAQRWRIVRWEGLEAATLVERLAAEAHSEDQSLEVFLSPRGRFVAGLEPVQPPAGRPPERVVITGGTRGIGLLAGRALVEAGHAVVLLGRRPLDPEAAAWAQSQGDRVQVRLTDLGRPAMVIEALQQEAPFDGLLHAAGVLADGPLETLSDEAFDRCWQVKVDGFRAALAAARPTAWALALGSWAARFGNRHQTAYAAANGALHSVSAEGLPIAVIEFGPWSQTGMATTLPPAAVAALRAEGVDFVSDQPGLSALLSARGASGALVAGRELPQRLRRRVTTWTLSPEAHPYLLDHAIEGVPVVPMAAVADWLAWLSQLPTPLEVADLVLYRGLPVRGETPVRIVLDGDRAEVLTGEDQGLAWTARVRPAGPAEPPTRLGGGEPSPLDLATFYREVTFHGPLLAGLVAVDGVGPDFVRGRVRTQRPERWEPATTRGAFQIDPLAIDSALQLTALVAWARYQRAGTPVGLRRLVQLAPIPEGELIVEARFGPPDGDRFTADFDLFAPDGTHLVHLEGAVAELKARSATAEVTIKPEWVDPERWTEVQDLHQRLWGVTQMGLRIPYFNVHEGTARNTSRIGGKDYINFSSYNYLGYSGDPRVLAAVHQAVEQYGTSVSASRVASGQRPFHTALEAELAAAQGTEDALVFTAGHAVNVTVIGHLMKSRDLILHDELIHDSALQGIRLSGAGRRSFRHEDPGHLEKLLRELRPHHEKVLIVVEGVYSMDGDLAALPAYLELKRRYGCLLMVDEAHSFGIVGPTGRGIGEHHGVPGSAVDLWMGTLSKSLASCGGWIAGRKVLIEYLRYTAPGFVYSAGLTPANGAAALASLRLMLEEPERVLRLQSNAALFHRELQRRGVNTGPAKGGSGVIPAITGNSMHALLLSQRLFDEGVNVQPIVYPAVADDAARLRFFLSSTHLEAELVSTAEKVARILEQVRAEFPI